MRQQREVKQMCRFGRILFALCLFQFSTAQVQLQPKPLVGVRGQNLTVTCSFPAGTAVIRLNLNGNENIQDHPRYLGISLVGNTAAEYRFGPLEDSDNGSVFTCTNIIGSTDSATLDVPYPPSYTVPSSEQSPTEGEQFSYQLTLDANPTPTEFNWTRNGTAVVSGTRITVTVDSITINNVSRSDSGPYLVVSRNSVGMGSGTFTLNVLYPPSLSTVNTSPRNLVVGQDLMLDCTPLPGNPPNTSVMFTVDGSGLNLSDPSVSVNTSVLTISNIQRRHRGSYLCEAFNGFGTNPNVNISVDVVGPPTSPRGLRIVDLQPFSARVTWSPPDDNGGVEPVHYRGNVSNGTVFDFNTTGITMTTLTHLQHSTDYSVSLLAENIHGASPPVEVVFRTPDSVPIIDVVKSDALSLLNITINITLLTTGGQNVTEFNITVDGVMTTRDTTEVPDSKLAMITIVIDGLTLTKGTNYDVSVTATNSIGTSEPVTGTLSVPNPPNITAPPSEVSPSSTSPCCAGVRLNLADPVDVSDVSVLLNTSSDGSYEMVSAGSLNLTGDILYIMELQAGTVYAANITVSNIFGSTTQQTVLKPLVGRPSNPAIPTATSDGTTVTVVLSTDYPGTERMRSGSMFSFQLQLTKDGRSARQSDTQVVSATPSGLSSPVTTTYQGVLSGGSYTVRVTAVNEHGSSESVVSEEFVVTEPTQPPPTTDSTPVIIGVVIGVVVAILLVIIIIFVGVILYMKFWKNKGHYLMKKESDTPSNYATNGSNNEKGEIEMIPNQPAVLYAAVDSSKMSQKEKEVADGHYDDPDVTKPPTTEGLVYADLEFTKRTTDYKKPPPKAEETVIYSEVTLQQQPPQGGSDRDERTNSPTTIM